LISCPACDKNLNYNTTTLIWSCKNKLCKHFNRRQFGGTVNKDKLLEEE